MAPFKLEKRTYYCYSILCAEKNGVEMRRLYHSSKSRMIQKRKYFAIVKAHFIEFKTFEFQIRLNLSYIYGIVHINKGKIAYHIFVHSIWFIKYFSTCMNASTIQMAKLILLWNIQRMYAIIKLSLFVFIFYFSNEFDIFLNMPFGDVSNFHCLRKTCFPMCTIVTLSLRNISDSRSQWYTVCIFP